MLKKNAKGKIQWGLSRKEKKQTEDEIRKLIQDRAYFIWEERGRPQGQEQEIWYQAEREIRAQVK